MNRPDLRKLLKDANTSLRQIAIQNGQTYSWVHRVAAGKANSEQVRQMIAKAVRRKPEEIWPEHYHGFQRMVAPRCGAPLRRWEDIRDFCLLHDIGYIEQLTGWMAADKEL